MSSTTSAKTLGSSPCSRASTGASPTRAGPWAGACPADRNDHQAERHEPERGHKPSRDRFHGLNIGRENGFVCRQMSYFGAFRASRASPLIRRDELEPAPDPQLPVDVGDVVPDRARGDEEALADVLVAGPLEDEAEDLLLANGQAVASEDSLQVLPQVLKRGSGLPPGSNGQGRAGGEEGDDGEKESPGPPERTPDFDPDREPFLVPDSRRDSRR